MDDIREELVLLRASLVEGELEWVDEDVQAEWESALSDETSPTPSTLPSLLLSIAPSASILVEYKLNERPIFTLHAASLEREDQARLAAEIERENEENARDVPTLPVFTLFTSIKDWIASNPVRSTEVVEEVKPVAPSPPKPGPITLKCTLLWSHHLLATSKRRDIVAWSTELRLFGISKPGYPGVIVIEGSQENVDEFVYRIKQLQWKALQVRCEEDGVVVTPPKEVPVTEVLEWVVRNRSHLGPVLSQDAHDKICVREVEGLNDLGDIMRKAGLEEVFLTALKISK